MPGKTFSPLAVELIRNGALHPHALYRDIKNIGPAKQNNIAGAGIESTRRNTICGAAPTIRRAVTVAIVSTNIQFVISNAHLWFAPSGLKKFSFLINRRDRTANSTYVGPPQIAVTTANVIYPCTFPPNVMV
jgi:hypothetical protein